MNSVTTDTSVNTKNAAAKAERMLSTLKKKTKKALNGPEQQPTEEKKQQQKVQTDPKKQAAFENVLKSIRKEYGDGALMCLGDAGKAEDISAISTGCLGIDHALGVGGFARGRIIEVFGPESSGKTTLALQAIASCHAAGGRAAFIDAEHALDMTYAENLGVLPEGLLLSQPDHGEQALEITESLVRSGAVDIVVLDSVAALVPRAEIEGEMGDAHMGLQARLMSQAMRKLAGVTYRTGCTLIFINQLRQKIGVVFGNPEVTTGGNALKFYASVRVEVRRIGSIKKEGEVVGNRTRIKVVKNKLAPPFKQVEVDVLYGRGIWQLGDLLDRATEMGLVEKSGSWFAFGDARLGQGREKAAEALASKPELKAKLLSLVAEKMNISPSRKNKECV